MITQETRERMENLIRCIQGKLNGKTMEWYDSNAEKWIPIAENDWNFLSTSKLRIAPEPQEKLKRWIVFDPEMHMSNHFDTLDGAMLYRDAHIPNGIIFEVTETARIEPKKREPRRVWVNYYPDNTRAAYIDKDSATNSTYEPIETVEFVEVVK